MATAVTLQELLTALYDSVDAARRTMHHQSVLEPLAASGPARRAMEILDAIGAADVAASTAFEITEVVLRFDCELYEHHGRTGVRLRTRRLWRQPVCLPLEIRLYGSQPLKADVRLGDRLLRTVAGRPRQ
jgi:hypothetical protein